MVRDLLLEIGTEEIPAGFMEKALADLKELARQELAKERLVCAEIVAYGTPRRLSLMVRDLADKQADVAEEIKGPSKKAGIDEVGNFTMAAQGFARSQGITVAELFGKDLNGVEYLYAVKREKGKETGDILPQLLPRLIIGMTFPKSMRWGDFELRFVRPIRWLLALFGDQVIEFELTGIKSDRYTYGHRFLAGKPLPVAKPEDYISVLKDGFVIVDQKVRKEMVWQQIVKLAGEEGGQVRLDEELLEEVTYLVEYPTALGGSFAEEYLELPLEVLITPMREHQRYFPVFHADGRLLNKFITIRNGNSDYLDIVRRGNEKVLAARLADARFFYREDVKTPLENLLPKLEEITYHEELGTSMAKVKRIEDLTGYLAEALGISAGEKEQALRVAKLAKADLVTSMVYEFPELQGIMGAYYAGVHGEEVAICQGIKEHYLPRFAGDELPVGVPGWLVSIADKLDTIVGCFSVGIQPTGSQDPYALRRQALAICHLLLAREAGLTVDQLLAAALRRLSKDIIPKISEDELIAELKEFFFQRLRNILIDKGHRYDVVEAVLAPGNSNLTEIVRWADALTLFRADQRFIGLLTGFIRASNLTKKSPGGSLLEELLAEPAEKELYAAFVQVKQKTKRFIAENQFLEALGELARLQQPIDRFFTEIMVMVEDEQVRNNRLALLQVITDFVKEKVDLTKIVAD